MGKNFVTKDSLGPVTARVASTSSIFALIVPDSIDNVWSLHYFTRDKGLHRLMALSAYMYNRSLGR